MWFRSKKELTKENLIKIVKGRIEDASQAAQNRMMAIATELTPDGLKDALTTLRVADGGGIAFGKNWILDNVAEADKSGSQPQKKGG